MPSILITGSSRGLGKSLALMFADNKYDLILNGRNEDALREVKQALIEKSAECDIIVGDITLTETISKLSKAARKRGLDILINNAGAYLNKSFTEMSIEEFKHILEVNLIAPVTLTHAIFPIFQGKKSGLIININSIAGKSASDGEVAYCISKHGLRGFSGALQFDATRNGIRVIDVYLGAMSTGMTEDREDIEKLITTFDATNLIFGLCKNYPSMRITKIDLNRRRY